MLFNSDKHKEKIAVEWNYKMLDRYILRKYLETFLLAMALIIVIVITFDVSEKLDDFLSNHAPFSSIVFDYYFNFIPGFVNLYSPLFIFISVIFFTSKMAGNTEIIAILSSGISYRRMLRPYLHGSLIVAIIVVAFGNFLIPESNTRLMEFDAKYIHPRRITFFDNVHFQQAEGVQVYAKSYDEVYLNVRNFHREIYTPNRQLRESLQVDEMVYDTTQHLWDCRGYHLRTVDSLREQLIYKPNVMKDFHIVPDDFSNASVHIETLNTVELYNYIQHEKMRGSQNVIESQIEFFQRIFNPIAIFIMTFIGVAVSSRKSRGGIGMHLAIGIALAFGFVVFMKITTVFATNGNWPPMLAVMTPQIVFGIIAVYLIRKTPK